MIIFNCLQFFINLITIISVVFAKRNYVFDPLDISYYKYTLPLELAIHNPNNENIILPFNTTRTPGSIESKRIQNFFKSFYYQKLNNNWQLDVDTHQNKGINFTNLIFTLNSKADKFIVLSAHYDSKTKPKGFIGGIDSAVSCSIILYVSKYIDNIYSTDKLNFKDEYGLKVVFFDGEEALNEWSSEDSLYGSRHLANEWENENVLKTIELFILMDLIGGQGNHNIPSFHRNTHKYYTLMSEIEKSYIKLSKDENVNEIKDYHLELDPTSRDYLNMNKIVIEDDHLPFYEKGVPTLHLITSPFPDVWHTIDDNFENLSQDNINKWAVIICEFLKTQLFL